MDSWKNVLAFALALALLIAGFRYGLRTMSGGGEKEAPAPEPAEWAAWKEERFGELGFSVRHPAEWPTVAGADAASGVGSMLAVASRPVFTVKVPKTLYKGTRFIDAFVTVSAGGDIPDKDAEGKALCGLLARQGSGTRSLSSVREIAGTSFTTGGVSTGKTGVRSESLVFHAWYRGTCIELSENLISAIGGRTADFDRVDAWKRLDDVVRTFKPLAGP